MNELLKAWCHWKSKEKDLSEDDREMIKYIQDVIGQVNHWKSRYEFAQAHLDAIYILMSEITEDRDSK